LFNESFYAKIGGHSLGGGNVDLFGLENEGLGPVIERKLRRGKWVLSLYEGWLALRLAELEGAGGVALKTGSGARRGGGRTSWMNHKLNLVVYRKTSTN